MLTKETFPEFVFIKHVHYFISHCYTISFNIHREAQKYTRVRTVGLHSPQNQIRHLPTCPALLQIRIHHHDHLLPYKPLA